MTKSTRPFVTLKQRNFLGILRLSLTIEPILEPSTSERRGDTPLFLQPIYNQLYLAKGFDVHLVCFEGENQERLSGVFGTRDNVMMSPFSAPFGGFWSSAAVSPDTYNACMTALVEYGKAQTLDKIRITLPATVYSRDTVQAQVEALTRAGFEKTCTDINHHLQLSDVSLEAGLRRGARRSLNKARSAGLSFKHALSQDDQLRAYRAIQLNRQQKQNPLHLTFDDLKQVAAITDVDFFLVEHQSNVIAGAVVYCVSSSVAQVVYWGNDVELNSLNSIHLLASCLYEHYQSSVEILDIGPSSKDGVIDEGLAAFKESLGCKPTDKLTLEKNF